ncbi:hypothetical protein D3C84_1096050 [compost metagenome]
MAPSTAANTPLYSAWSTTKASKAVVLKPSKRITDSSRRLRSTAARAPAQIAANAPATASAAMIQNTKVRLRLNDCTWAMAGAWVETSNWRSAKKRRNGSTSVRLRAYRRKAG